MKSEHVEIKPFKRMPNESLMLNLMLFRQDAKSIFHFDKTPKDVTNYIINILSRLPGNNIFDRLTSGLIAACNNYKNDYIWFPNDDALADEVVEFTKLLIVEREKDEKRAFIFLNYYLFELIFVLSVYKKDTKFLNKISGFLEKLDCRIIYDLACDAKTNALFDGGYHGKSTIEFAYNKLNELGQVLIKSECDRTHASLSSVIMGLLCHLSLRQSFTNGYLNNYLLNNSGPFCPELREKLLADLNQFYKYYITQTDGSLAYKRISSAISYSEHIANNIKNAAINTRLDREIDFYLEQDQPDKQLSLTRK